jgi:hypothetical protein
MIAHANQTGYKFSNGKKEVLHAVIEDVLVHCERYPSLTQVLETYPSNFGHRIFLMADGHAGSEAPHWFTARLSGDLMTLLNDTDYDLSLPEHQTILKEKVHEIFIIADAEYVAIKVNQYQNWVAGGSHVDDKPVDDGCTMMVNVVRDGYIMNMNGKLT